MSSFAKDFLNCHNSLILINNSIKELIIMRIATKNLCIGNIMHGYICRSLKKLQNDKRKKIKMIDAHIYLKELYLSDNQIVDLSPLSNMVNLQLLDLNNNQIIDLSPLRNLIGTKIKF